MIWKSLLQSKQSSNRGDTLNSAPSIVMKRCSISLKISQCVLNHAHSSDFRNFLRRKRCEEIESEKFKRGLKSCLRQEFEVGDEIAFAEIHEVNYHWVFRMFIWIRKLVMGSVWTDACERFCIEWYENWSFQIWSYCWHSVILKRFIKRGIIERMYDRYN